MGVWRPLVSVTRAESCERSPARYTRPHLELFGGGSTLFSGRQSVSDEILVFAAMFLLSLDTEFNADARRMPPRDDSNTRCIAKPKEDIVLRLLRWGTEEAPWGIRK